MKRLVVLGLVMSLVLVGAPSLAAPFSGMFNDDDGNVHEPNIQAIAQEGITLGCGPSVYCPGRTIRRDEMASFLARALQLPMQTTGPFTDVGNNIHAGAINAIANAGVTLGCAPDRYCPAEPVRRDQMASFLARAFALAATPSPFTDTVGNVHEANIGAIAGAGITLGCAASQYCPTGLVRRDEMASFLARALDLEPVYVLLGMGSGLPLNCSKDGLHCTGAFTVPLRTFYGISEGFYQILPYMGDEQAQLQSTSTRFELTLNGFLQNLQPVTVESTGSVEKRFEGTIGLSRGGHQLIARWYWNGQLTQTTVLNLTVSG